MHLSAVRARNKSWPKFAPRPWMLLLLTASLWVTGVLCMTDEEIRGLRYTYTFPSNQLL